MWSNKEADFFPEINKKFHFPWNGPCVFILGGGLGFLGWGGFFVAMKKIWVCCHVQINVQLYDALIYISMPA